MPTAPEIERVEWRSSSAGELWVEVHGRWPGRPQDETLVLLVGEGSQPIAFRVRRVRWGVEAEVSARAEGPASEASGGDQFRAGFAIPVHLRRDLGTRLALRVGQHEIALPVARAARLAVEATSPPNVVDPAVLAERRARRAELGEETLARQAARAEAQVQDLEAQLDQLEHQLQDALAERERLKRELSARERELRVVRQREYSEQQLRVEAEEQRVRGERQARLGVEASRRELSAAEGRIRELETELERGRRNVAESEHAAQGPLQDELRRRQAVHDHVRAELETMRQELARLQADAQLEEQRRAHAEALAAELERTVSVLRDQLEVRERALTEAEQMVAALRGQTAELMRTLEGERRDHLDAERELRTQLEAQAAAVQSTTAELRDELARATQESHERERREAELLELLAEFVETATTLRETFEREMAQVREELEARLAAERDGYTQQLSEFEDRVWRLRGQLEDAAALSEELELRSRTEAQAREALADAHAELRRLQHSETRARTELAQLRAELAAGTSTAERTSTGAGAPPREPAPGELELEGAASVPARSEPPPAEAIPDETTVSDRTVEEAPRRGTGEAPRRGTGEAPRRGTGEAPRRGTGEERRVRAADLTDAFRRLRERAAEGTREFPPPDAPSWMPQAPRTGSAPPPLRYPEPPPPPIGPPGPAIASTPRGAPPSPVAPKAPAPREPLAAPRTPPAPPEPPAAPPEPPAARGTPAASLPATASPPRAEAPLSSLPREVGRERQPWLTSALVDMAQADDSRPAGRLLIELLPLQGLFVKRQLTYELEVEELGEFRVTISDGRASVEPRGSKEESGPGEVDFQLSGRIADLAPLVGGSPPRRLPGVRVTGRRRRLRHLLRRLRRPVALVDLARADVQPEPGLLLRAVVNGIDPAWTDGHEFSVVYAIEGAGDGEEERRFHVEVHRGEPVRVIEGTAERGGELEVSAALRVPRPALVALLAGLPLPAGQRAEVEGDGGRIVLLGEWIERAQRRSGGRR